MDATNKFSTTIAYEYYWVIGFMLGVAFLLGSVWLFDYLPDGWAAEIGNFCIVPVILLAFMMLKLSNAQTEPRNKAINLSILPRVLGLIGSIMCITLAIAAEVQPTGKLVLPISLLLLFDVVFAVQLLRGKYTVRASGSADNH